LAQVAVAVLLSFVHTCWRRQWRGWWCRARTCAGVAPGLWWEVLSGEADILGDTRCGASRGIVPSGEVVRASVAAVVHPRGGGEEEATARGWDLGPSLIPIGAMAGSADFLKRDGVVMGVTMSMGAGPS
jgi:hypothetical protein